jgi:integrase
LAVKWGMIARNPISAVEQPRRRQLERKTFDPAQLDSFLETARGHALWPLFQIAATLGLRSGELLALTWADVDLDARSLTVNHTMQRMAGEIVLAEPKSRQSHRTIPLPDGIAETLRAHRLAQNEARLLLGSEWQAEPDFVFRTGTGRPVDGRNLTRSFHQIQREAYKATNPKARNNDIPVLGIHSLRHRAASLMLSAGVNPKTASEVLGHSSVRLTLDLYSHVESETKRAAIESVDRLIRRK